MQGIPSPILIDRTTIPTKDYNNIKNNDNDLLNKSKKPKKCLFIDTNLPLENNNEISNINIDNTYKKCNKKS